MIAKSQYTAFRGSNRVAAGALTEVARAVAALDVDDAGVLILDDTSGEVVDLDPRLSPEEAAQAWEARDAGPTPPAARRGRGRPKLGVVAREVTLLPRHWDWLASQPGGASAALRRLIEAARRSETSADAARRAREATYRAMFALAGDRPGFEEASRALFAGDRASFVSLADKWPPDIANYLEGRLAVED